MSASALSQLSILLLVLHYLNIKTSSNHNLGIYSIKVLIIICSSHVIIIWQHLLLHFMRYSFSLVVIGVMELKKKYLVISKHMADEELNLNSFLHHSHSCHLLLHQVNIGFFFTQLLAEFSSCLPHLMFCLHLL